MQHGIRRVIGAGLAVMMLALVGGCTILSGGKTGGAPSTVSGPGTPESTPGASAMAAGVGRQAEPEARASWLQRTASGVVYGVAVMVLLGVSIFVHELGHFLVALKAGMVIEVFSIGFGPAIWKRKVRGITYKIGWIPFGGYVALPQLDPTGMALIQGDPSGAGVPVQRLPEVSPWIRILVIVSGVVGNILLAVALAWIIYLVPQPLSQEDEGRPFIGRVETNSVSWTAGFRPGQEIIGVAGKPVGSWYEVAVESMLAVDNSNGVPFRVRLPEGGEAEFAVALTRDEDEMYRIPGLEKSLLCVVQAVSPDSPAAAAGLEAEDVIQRVDGERVMNPEQFREAMANRDGLAARLVIERKGETKEVTVTPRFNAALGRSIIGTAVAPGIRGGDMPWMRYRKPLDQMRNDAMSIVRILRALVTPREAKKAAGALGGPVMIIAALVVSIKVSLLNAVGFLRFLNVNLAIINLLPIPVLDGGHIVFAAWEGITRRKVPARLVNILTNVFAVLLIGLLLIITYKDIRQRLPRLFGREDRRESVQTSATETNVPATAGTEIHPVP